jgi:hypothetical protein
VRLGPRAVGGAQHRACGRGGRRRRGGRGGWGFLGWWGGFLAGDLGWCKPPPAKRRGGKGAPQKGPCSPQRQPPPPTRVAHAGAGGGPRVVKESKGEVVRGVLGARGGGGCVVRFWRGAGTNGWRGSGEASWAGPGGGRFEGCSSDAAGPVACRAFRAGR